MPIENIDGYGFEEVYEVVQTVEVVGGTDRYRVEVLKVYSNPKIPYTARVYLEENDLWKLTVFPWIGRDTAESALASALSSVSELAGS
jgi:hypothetical protein